VLAWDVTTFAIVARIYLVRLEREPLTLRSIVSLSVHPRLYRR
jgi:hypothetical protein